MSRREASLRAVASAVLMVLLVGPVLGLLHEIGARHHFCAEHGVLEEAAEPAGEASSNDALPDRSLTRGPPERAPDEHAACAFDPGVLPPAAEAARASASTDAEPPRGTTRRPSSRPRHVTSLIRIAPKTSPPTAAFA
jgi:hypothetical protein